MTFAACLSVILESEGGYVCDQGGPTNLGVTMPALSAWLHRSVTEADIAALTPQTVAPLYQRNYYDACHCGELPPGADLMVFDEAVNEGTGRAIRHMQKALGVAADGLFGPVTAAAIAAMDVRAFIAAMHDLNAAFYADLAADYPDDEAGWQARNDRTRDAALAMVNP